MSLRFIAHVDRIALEPATAVTESGRRFQHQEIVRTALNRIGATERFVIVRLYYYRDSQPQLCRRLRLSTERLDYIRRRALTRLRCLLSAYVRREFGVSAAPPPCSLCQSQHRAEIDAYLATLRTPLNREVINRLHSHFGVRLRSLRMLSEHINYHHFEEVSV